MDAIQRTINLRAGQHTRYTKHRMPRTRNMTFPSLKKYLSCRTNELSGVMCLPLGVLSSSTRLACLASNSVLGRQTALEVVGNFFQPLSVSDNVESNETIEAALDRTGDVQSSLSLQVQEMTRWAIKRKILYLGIHPIMDNAQKNPNSLEQAFRKHNHIVLDKEDLEVGRTIRVRSDWLHWNQPSLDAFPIYYVTVALPPSSYFR